MGSIIRVLLIALFWTTAATGQSGNQVTDLSPWQGEFISRHSLMDHPDMIPFYTKTAEAARKLGKSYTADAVKERLVRLSHTDFDRILIKDNTITFYRDTSGQTIMKTFNYAGEKSDTYGHTAFAWYGFTSDRGDSAVDFDYLILLKTHTHDKGIPHFHLRYSRKGFDTLTGPEFKEWWPTMLPKGVDVETLVSGMDPEKIASLIL